MKYVSVVLFLVCLLPGLATAETRYIRDELVMNLRAGPGTDYDVAFSSVRSGTAVELTGEREGSWVEVRLNGELAWVNRYYLQETPVAEARLAQLQDEYDALKAEFEQSLADGPLTVEEVAELRQQIAQAQQAKDEALARVEAIEQLNENAIALDARNEELTQRNRELENKLQQLEAENQLLRDGEATQNWLVLGIGGFAAFCILMFFFAMRPKNKRHDTWV